MGEESVMPTNARRVRQGGLMRCCLHTLAEHDELSEAGDVLECDYCSGCMLVAADGIWEWERDR